MEAIDQAPFNFDPRIGLIVGIMVGFLVFAVALDLTWEQLRRVLKSPKAPAIGLVAPKRVVITLLIMLIIPVTVGVLLRGKVPTPPTRSAFARVASQGSYSPWWWR